MQVDSACVSRSNKISVLFFVFYIIIRDKIIKYLMFPFPFSYKQDLLKFLDTLVTLSLHPKFIQHYQYTHYKMPRSSTQYRPLQLMYLSQILPCKKITAVLCTAYSGQA